MSSLAGKILSSITKGYQLLKKNDPLILSAATAFFTTFSMGPVVILLTDLLTPVLGKENVRHELFSKIEGLLGTDTAKDVFTIVDGFREQETTFLLTTFSTLFFYFIVTTLFNAIKQAIHQIWDIKKKSSRKLMYFVKERLSGVGMVLLAALLTLTSYYMDISLAGLNHETWVFGTFNGLFSFLIILTWFTLLLKFLPEAHVSWQVAFVGGLFTSILFKGGLEGLEKLFVHKKFAMIFGVSSSAVMLLLFIFYCAIILYLGVSFTYEFAKAIKQPILPGRYAVRFKEDTTRETPSSL